MCVVGSVVNVVCGIINRDLISTLNNALLFLLVGHNMENRRRSSISLSSIMNILFINSFV